MFVSRLLIGALAAGLTLLVGCSDSSPTSDAPLNCSGGVPLAVGVTVNGTLEEGDDLDVDQAFLDAYALTVDQSATIRITMRSADVDSWLWLLSGTDVLDSDNNSGGGESGLDARIERTLARGCYIVEATSLGAGQTGAYTVTTVQL